jgi:hypothetical protein
MKKSEKEKSRNLPYTATHGLGRSFRQGRQAGKRQTFKAAQVRVHRFRGKRRQRATRGKPNSPALLSMCVRSELCSRAPLFLPPLSVVCFLLYPAHHHHHHLSLSLSPVAVGHNSLDFLRRSLVGRWREWPRKWRQKGRSSTLCRMSQSTIVLTIAGSLSVARWRIHVLYGALSFLFVCLVFVCCYHCACFCFLGDFVF